MITSLAIALTTLPMPRDVIYPFAGPSYGTIGTCEAQGLAYVVGNGLVYSTNGILNFYYACTLSFNMKEATFQKYFEFPLYIGAILASVLSSTLKLLKNGLLNPSPNDSFCTPDLYPVGCDIVDNPECRGGGKENYRIFSQMYLASMGVVFCTLASTMGLIIHTFYKSERSLRNQVDNVPGINKNLRELNRARRMTRIITIQALMYVGAFLLSWTFTFIAFFYGDDGGPYLVQLLRTIFQPLQGLLNMLIFFYHKISMIIRSDEGKTVGDALQILLLKPKETPDAVAISSIELVIEHDIMRSMGMDAGDFIASAEPNHSEGFQQSHAVTETGKATAGVSRSSKSVRFEDGVSYDTSRPMGGRDLSKCASIMDSVSDSFDDNVSRVPSNSVMSNLSGFSSFFPKSARSDNDISYASKSVSRTETTKAPKTSSRRDNNISSQSKTITIGKEDFVNDIDEKSSRSILSGLSSMYRN